MAELLPLKDTSSSRKAIGSQRVVSLCENGQKHDEVTIHLNLEWLSRDNLSSPPFALVAYRHVKNRAQLFKASLA